MQTYDIEIKSGVSKGRDTYGYNTRTLYENGKRLTGCNGGGYDMTGTVFANWITMRFADRLLKLKKEHYGLSFHDPNYKVGKAVLPSGKTVEEAEAARESLGLERYQQTFAASSKVPTERHVVPHFDGATGINNVERLLRRIGGDIRQVRASGYRRSELHIVSMYDVDVAKLEEIGEDIEAQYEQHRKNDVPYGERFCLIRHEVTDEEKALLERIHYNYHLTFAKEVK
jgi:hypothetical protein